MKIPANVFEGFAKWMVRGLWPAHLQIVLHEHFSEFCDAHDINSFEEMADDIGSPTLTTLRDIAFNDFLSRETEEGNVVDDYLKRRGWKETAIGRSYLQAIRDSVLSLYEVSDIRPGYSFLAQDLLLGGDPVRVEEHAAIKTLKHQEHIAAWIVEVRDHRIISGGILPFEPELSAQLQEELHRMADEVELGIEEIVGDDDLPDDQIMLKMTRALTLKTGAPVFSATWLAGIDVAASSLPH